MEELRYPIGKFQLPGIITSEQFSSWKNDIVALPSKVQQLTDGFKAHHWSQTYRPEGWTALQLVHHLADSHMNCFIRFKWSLTEENPTIKAYDEKAWANLPDVTQSSPMISIQLLHALHQRWINLINNMTEQDFEKTFFHPIQQKTHSLKGAVGLYAWHGNHHLAHLKIIADK